MVCPVNLRKGLSSVGALDNLDHNPSSTTAQGSFHGTEISIIQFPTEENQELCRGATYGSDKLGQKPSFAESFTNVPATYMNDKPPIPRVTPTEKEFQGELSPAIAKGKCWIQHSVHLL